jgi:hypothetical protein
VLSRLHALKIKALLKRFFGKCRERLHGAALLLLPHPIVALVSVAKQLQILVE